MNVVKCKRRILLFLNTGMLFVSLSHHCQEMPYLMLKHLGIYDCGKHVLFLKFMCCVPLPMLSFVCELAMVVAHLASLNSLHIGNILKLNPFPKSHAKIEMIELEIVGCILAIFQSLILFLNHIISSPFVICRWMVFKSIFPSINGGRQSTSETTSIFHWIGVSSLLKNSELSWYSR